MKKGLFAFVLLACVGALNVGCSDPCGDLEEQITPCCDKKDDLAAQATCTAGKVVVNADDSDACDAALDTYKCE